MRRLPVCANAQVPLVRAVHVIGICRMRPNTSYLRTRFAIWRANELPVTAISLSGHGRCPTPAAAVARRMAAIPSECCSFSGSLELGPHRRPMKAPTFTADFLEG